MGGLNIRGKGLALEPPRSGLYNIDEAARIANGNFGSACEIKALLPKRQIVMAMMIVAILLRTVAVNDDGKTRIILVIILIRTYIVIVANT